MNYAVSFLICALEILLLWLYFRKQNIFEMESIEGEERTASKVDNTQISIAVSLIGMLLGVATVLTLENVANYLNYLKLILLLGIVAGAGVVDYKRTIIPNQFIIIGLIIRGVIYIAEYFIFSETFYSQLISDLIGVAFGFGFLLIVALISKGAIGFGDVKLFGVIGLLSGAICTYYTLLFSLVASAMVSLILLITKKKNRGDSIPFGPFILMGYFVAIVLSCY